MNTPEWLKPGIYGAIVGAVAASAIGFSWGGWVTASGAAKMADATARGAVISAMLPICIEQSRVDPERAAKMATINAASTYQRREAVMATGWATAPGATAADRDLAQACQEGLKGEAS